MTMQGGREDDALGQPLTAFSSGKSGGSYRQDDAPHSVDPASVMPEGSGAPPPSRSVPELLTALAATPNEFARLIEGKSDEALAQPATDGEWGVVEILPHLHDWEEVHRIWIQQMLDEDVPELMVVDDSLWAIEHDYANENVPAVLARFAERRDEVVHMLESLEDTAWERGAIHPQLGPITLHQLADRMCDHDARHIEQARDALG